MKIKAVAVDLEEDQIDAIRPMMAKAALAAEEGQPGMLLAQVFLSHMKVFFVASEQAEAFQRIMGQEVGRTSGTSPLKSQKPV